MRIYYAVDEAATSEDIRIAALLRAEGHVVTFCNARLCRTIAEIRGADKVVYNGIEEKYLAVIEDYCQTLKIVCDPAIPIPLNPIVANLQLKPLIQNSTLIRRKQATK